MNEKLKERLNQILPRLESKEFLENSGLGNEIGFYIFDYSPEEELEVRNHVQIVLDQLAKKRPDLRVAHINLFKLIVDYLTERDLLDRVLKLQLGKGDDALRKALRAPLHEEKVATRPLSRLPGLTSMTWSLSPASAMPGPSCDPIPY